MKIIGTAGHVDHGKSTLIAALTGVHPDRLKEEKEREMTIDLGFGWMVLSDGQEVGIIDVPGHRDFIGNMLAGIGGIDMVMLVIAADEGVMPQTSEHLAIINLLHIQDGIIVLTKTDLASDSDWLNMIEDDIRRAVNNTCLQDAPIVRISAKKNIGLTELKAVIEEKLAHNQDKADKAKPRLQVDRVFSMQGFGTVVTGTLIDGSLSVGNDVVCLPTGHKGKVRGLQTHKKKEEVAITGSRTAVNISGIHMDDISRGDVITLPGLFEPTRRFDCTIHVLKDLPNGLSNNAEMKLYIGADETICNCRVLGGQTILPGSEGLLQIETRDPIVTARGDRFILRQPSPSETFAGGQVLDPHPAGRHKRQDPKMIARLDSMLYGDPVDIILTHASNAGIRSIKDLIAASGLEPVIAQQALSECIQSGSIIRLDESTTPEALVIGKATLDKTSHILRTITSEFHRSNPLRSGIPREELKSRAKLPGKQAAFFLKHSGLVENNGMISIPGYSVEYSAAQKDATDKVRNLLLQQPFSPPPTSEIRSMLGEDLFKSFIENGSLVQVAQDVVFLSETYHEMVQILRSTFGSNPFSAAQARDVFNSSRKYVLALLEYLDNKGITRRNGDERICL